MEGRLPTIYYAHKTERLLVSHSRVPATELCYERDLFVARWLHEDQPEVIAHATVWVGSITGNTLEWIEVNQRDRRRGIGREF